MFLPFQIVLFFIKIVPLLAGYLRVLEYRSDAYQEIDAHPLGEKEKDEILSEVDLRPDISSCWNREMLPEIVPRLCWKYGVGQGMDMS